MKKFKTWFLRNWKIIKYILILMGFLGGYVIIWIACFPSDYILDLSVSISDFLQLLVIAAAVFAPLLVDYIRKKRQSPIITITPFEDKRDITSHKKRLYVSDEKVYRSDFESLAYCLTIKNTGKSLMKDCEAVLSRIYVVEGDKNVIEFALPQCNLKWFDYFRVQRIDINPQREQRVALLFHQFLIKGAKSNVKFFIYDSADIYDQMIDLSIGTYFFEINFYSSNANPGYALVKFTFPEGQKKIANQMEYKYPKGQLKICKTENYIPDSEVNILPFL